MSAVMLEGPLQHAPGEGAIELFISDVQHRKARLRGGRGTAEAVSVTRAVVLARNYR